MKYCTHCGNKNEEDSVFCVHCGRPFEEVKKMVNRYAEKISETDKVERKGQVSTKEASSSKYMSKVELWSWLKRQSQRQKYFTEEKSDLSFNDFINKVNHKMQENEVPASLEVKKIQWDRENVSQTVCYVEPDTNVANPLTRLIHFEHIGKFTFVEEKTFITPPDLPEVPRKEKKISSLLKNWIIFVLIGVALKLITGFNYGGDVNFYSDDSYSVISIALIVIGICLFIKYMMVIGYNNSCKKQEKKWNTAWDNWHKTIFTYSFQEDINGRLSRIFDAVSACIKQVSEEEFKDAQTSIKEEETANINELEEMIKRRQEEYR